MDMKLPAQLAWLPTEHTGWLVCAGCALCVVVAALYDIYQAVEGEPVSVSGYITAKALVVVYWVLFMGWWWHEIKMREGWQGLF